VRFYLGNLSSRPGLIKSRRTCHNPSLIRSPAMFHVFPSCFYLDSFLCESGLRKIVYVLALDGVNTKNLVPRCLACVTVMYYGRLCNFHYLGFRNLFTVGVRCKSGRPILPWAFVLPEHF
jgi:hypothetical protein